MRLRTFSVLFLITGSVPFIVRAPLSAQQAAASTRACLAANGLAYGPFRDGQGPEGMNPVYPRVEQITEDLKFVGQLTKRIRTYSTTSTQADVPRLARPFGISVAQGIFLGPDDDENDRQIKDAVRLAREGLVTSLIVGNEVLTAADQSKISKSKLIEYLRRVRKEAPRNVPVTTAEVWNQWLSNPELVQEVDFVMAHFYPFWEGRPIASSNEDLWRNYDALQQKLVTANRGRPVRIVIGETGWPSAGSAEKAAIPSNENHRRFAESFMASACRRSVEFYYFSAFDEEWKWREGNSASGRDQPLPRDRSFSGRYVGSSWGLFDATGRLKSPLAGFFPQLVPGSRLEREIFADGMLSMYYNIGVDTSHKQRKWLKVGDELQMDYPAKQDWGAVFITVGDPTNPPRPSRDFSRFDSIAFDLRGARGQEKVAIGIKPFNDPGTGQEKRIELKEVGRDYKPYSFKLSEFGQDVKKLNVVLEFVFIGDAPRTVYAKNIRYVAKE